jgi:cytochrome c-type biogenesis protein
MIDQLFTTLTMAMSEQFGIALAASFAWGVASILLSPCHLTSIPLVVGYLVGQGPANARRSAWLSTLFALGILITVALIGIITASIGRMLGDVGIWGNLVVGGVFLLVGLQLLDVVKLSWNPIALNPVNARPWAGALLLGLIFGIGLGPCTFAFLAPVLGVVFTLSVTDMTSALLLIAAFGIGHCSVIVAAGTLAHSLQRFLTWFDGSTRPVLIKRFAGILVLLGGAYFLYSSI